MDHSFFNKMRLIFIVIYLGFMVSAKRRKPKPENSSYYEEDSYLNLEGSVRREFAMVAALKDHTENMICSPLSVFMPLGKLAMGAGARTKKELLDALAIPSEEQLKPTFKELITSLKYLPGVSLDVANRIYVSTKKSIKKEFAHDAELIFESSCEKITTSNPKKTAKDINKWVAEKTKNKITHLIDSGDITEETSLILVNAIYFAGKWLHKFKHTFTDDFFSPAGRVRMSMMSRVGGSYNYWKCDILDAQIIEIPYEGSQSAMIIVLPYVDNDIEYLLRKLKKKPHLLNNALKKIKITDITLEMPKFKIESEIDLIRIFEKIGVKSIFDSIQSDLDSIIKDETVFVSKAIHKAIIEVTELGTEASAATALELMTMSAGVVSYTPTMTVNRPFLFYIRAYKELLFAGVFNGNI